MFKRRNRVTVVLSILNACSGGAAKTKIAHQANLNYVSVSSYLEVLKNEGLLEEIPKSSGFIYRTTPKGLDWRNRLKQSVTLLEVIGITA
jgi:predicted transcriptional regulator